MLIMKYNMKSIVWMLFVMLVFSSCDSFLDMEPSNSGNADDAIATVDDAEIVMAGIMSTLTSSSYYGRNMFMYGDAKGGDLTIYSAGRGLDALYSFNHSATSNSYSGFWSTGYYCILQINTLLENIESLEEAGETGFDFCKGQALTLRAMVYFDLVRLYGLPYNYEKTSNGVPLTLTPLESNAELSRSTVEEVYAQILLDIEEGKELLSDDKSAQEGYVGYYANLAIGARVKLYMENYDGALTNAEEIIESGEYSLYENSEWVDSWQSQFGSESILELGIYPSESDLGSSSLGYYLMQYGQLSGAMGYFLASDYFLDRLGEDSTDVRWGIMDNDEYWVNYGISRKGACYKYMGGVVLDDGTFPGDGKSTSTAVNIKMIRLSEIYLIAAEAALHSTSPDADGAAGYLNEIRKRAPGLELATATTISDEMILKERSTELFGEGQRFFDMIRMNQSITYNDDFQDVPVSTRETTIDRTFGKIVLPISQDEINANSALEDEQNEAYQ
jgi:hypothetical protein